MRSKRTSMPRATSVGNSFPDVRHHIIRKTERQIDLGTTRSRQRRIRMELASACKAPHRTDIAAKTSSCATCFSKPLTTKDCAMFPYGSKHECRCSQRAQTNRSMRASKISLPNDRKALAALQRKPRQGPRRFQREQPSICYFRWLPFSAKSQLQLKLQFSFPC